METVFCFLYLDKDKSKNLDDLSEIRRIVYSLYTSLNAQDEKGKEEKFVADKLAEIQAQLEPLEKVITFAQKKPGFFMFHKCFFVSCTVSCRNDND